jgi:hypothetical protein
MRGRHMHISVKVSALLLVLLLIPLISVEGQSHSYNYAIYGVDADIRASTVSLATSKCGAFFSLEKDSSMNFYRFSSIVSTSFDKECSWRIVKYSHKNKEYYALLTSDINITVYPDPQWWHVLVIALSLNFWRPTTYNYSVLIYMGYSDFVRAYRIESDVKETAKDIVAIILEPLGSIVGVFRSAAELVGKAASAVIDAFRVIASVIGKPGDMNSVMWATSYRTQLMPYAGNPYIGLDIQMVLNCSKPLGEVRGLLKSFREQDLQKTICDVENEAPVGILGVLSIVFAVISSVIAMFPTIMKYFVLINAVVFMAILALYGAKAIKRQDLSYIADGFKIIYGILKFYFSIVVFIVNLIIKGVQALSQVAQALISIAQALHGALRDVADKIIDFLGSII